MVRDVTLEAIEAFAGSLIAVGNVYADGHVIAPHRHRRGQLISGATGTVVLATAQATWVMPPQRGLWIPPGVEHDVQMIGAVSLHSLYLEPATAAFMPDACAVVGISPFLRSLMAEALDLPVAVPPDSRAGALLALLLHEMRALRKLPLALPLPAHPALNRQCRDFLRRPDAHATIDGWCAMLGLSRRSFTRLFRGQTGLSFSAWRQQACVIAALPRLAAGAAVTDVAMTFGYDNPAAFTTMFRRVLGAPPRAYLRNTPEGP